ncbi:hypothetical protein AVEN_245987-1 [Araneus ventricosus]|uniref:Uncharacterized protein n=1 Tax=Araneus ventricosus TaxID=182803 RepID=A0A4Y2RDI5_ARAVE|nr:hypothetical protein AVEN_245987-1 [Araneus ventricosus]
MSGVGKLDFPLRHLLCSVTHGVGKKLLVANDLGGSYNICCLDDKSKDKRRVSASFYPFRAPPSGLSSHSTTLTSHRGVTFGRTSLFW